MGDLSRHFSRSEFACKCDYGCEFDTVDVELLAVVMDVRAYFKAPVTITSACRCRAHNDDVGGAMNSQHTKGRASDIIVEGVSAPAVYAYLAISYPGKLGLGKYADFTHIDTRTGGARWEG